MKVDKDLRPVLKRLKDVGCEIQGPSGRGKSHTKVIWQGRMVGVISGSPSDVRSTKNLVSDLRRAGVPI